MAAPDLSVFDRIKTKADFDRAEEEFNLKRLAVQKAQQGNLPAALQIADRLTKLRTSGDPNADQQIQDVMMAQKMLRVDPGVYMQDGMAQEIPNYSGVVGGIEGAKAYGKQEAQNYSDRVWVPGTDAAREAAKQGRSPGETPYTAKELEQQKADVARMDKLRGESDTNAKTLPIIEELKGYNEQSPTLAYANLQQPFRKLYPGTSPQEAAVDLMTQARIDLAAPLAKQLGVNPTDKDFQSSLDRIFDISASKESRANQINALEGRIRARQQQLSAVGMQGGTPGVPKLDLKNIPMDAVRELKADPSGAAEFDEVFGEGAARLILGGQ